jgi:Mg2+ and Co2+ transporter CorA
MNFEFMPELHWANGYGYVWLLIVLTGTVVVYWFKKINIL